MAVLCLSQTRLGPGPRQQGRQVQEEGFPTLGTERSVEWRGRSAAEVCTSEARKIGVPLVTRQGRSPSAGLVSMHQLEAQRLVSFWFRLVGVGVADGKGAQKCVVEDSTAGWNRVGDLKRAEERADRFVSAGKTPATCGRDLRLLRNCWPKWSGCYRE
jgi:hypothetical protein